MSDEWSETDEWPLPRYSGPSKVAATFHPSAKISPLTGAGAENDSQPTGGAHKAREARYAEVINRANEETIAELRAEVERLRRRLGRMTGIARDRGDSLNFADDHLPQWHAIRTERDRLTAQRDEWMAALEQWEARTETAEAERDRLQAAMAALADELTRLGAQAHGDDGSPRGLAAEPTAEAAADREGGA